MSEIQLNIIFPVGQKPNVKICESKFAEKDCYVYWDMEYLKLRPIWMPEQDIKHKEVYGINSMINAVKNLEQQNNQLQENNEELKDVVKHLKITLQSLGYDEDSSFGDIREVFKRADKVLENKDE